MNLIFLRSLFSKLYSLAALAAIACGLSVPANAAEPNRAIAHSQLDHTPIVAQTNPDLEVEPGRRTRSGSSYIGIGGNIGLTGDSPVGDGAFAVFSKIGLTRSFSARPSAVINDDAVFLIPATIDFSGDEVPEAGFRVAPYLGGGVAISTEDDGDFGGLITGGLDVPISSQFTANTSANVTFMDDTDLGLQVGVGYNF
jgi:hypothetical protein